MPSRSVLLAEDETDILLFPPLRKAWRLRGEPGNVELSGRNARRVVFGAMNLCTGRRWFLVRKRGRGEDFRAFLNLLHEHYRSWQVALLLDEDSSHTDGKSQVLAKELSIKLIWMPKRSPKLNPMEHLWGQGKDLISANRQYATIEQQVDLFVEHLENLTPRGALRTSGVLAPRFWLKSVLSKNFCGPA